MTTVEINGKSRQVDVPDDMPLLWVLRDVLATSAQAAGRRTAARRLKQHASMSKRID